MGKFKGRRSKGYNNKMKIIEINERVLDKINYFPINFNRLLTLENQQMKFSPGTCMENTITFESQSNITK